MRGFVITLKGNTYSEKKAAECIKSADKYMHGPNLKLEIFYGIDKNVASQLMEEHNLKWTWANMNTRKTICPITKLVQHPYGARDIKAVMGCFMSHFLLWKKCVKLNETILILEHDSVFKRSFPCYINFKFICSINDPRGATSSGAKWSDLMNSRKEGIYPKTRIRPKGTPDGLPGNSAYLIKPFAAQQLIDKSYELGVWPNDALICEENFPNLLEEYCPPITYVNSNYSTTREK
jgi:GR25 family glycosyltransferase involved in LPS biosynthesis